MQEELDVARWVVPFYLQFQHGNFVSPSMHFKQTQAQWNDLVREQLTRFNYEIAGDLMMDDDWRPQMAGSWFVGFKRWDDFTVDIGRRLVAKKNGFATQGYSFALARMPSHGAANYLNAYLQHIGQRQDTTGWYGVDSEWVIAALQWVDEKLQTNYAQESLEHLVPYWGEKAFKANRNRYLGMVELKQTTSEEYFKKGWSYAQVEARLEALEKEATPPYQPPTSLERPEWFWKIMAYCEEHFDAAN